MYLLDTDHISLLHRDGPESKRIQARLSTVPAEQVFFSIVSYEEQTRGWIAELGRKRAIDLQQPIYAELARMLDLYCATRLLYFDERAVETYQRLWLQRLRVGTMDLKIAAIAIANSATLLTRNMADFRKIPGLQCEDWSA